MATSPDISVVMPVFNGERFLAVGIDSVLKQSHRNIELLVIDDGSTDNSANIVHSFNDPRIRLILNGSNQGVIRTRNRGIREARGECIAFLDCDDIALPERLAIQFNFMRDNPAFILVGSWIALINSYGKYTGEFFRTTNSPEAIPSAMLFDNCFAQSAVLARRETLLKEQYREEYPCAEDYDLFARLALAGKCGNIRRVLNLYRDHGGGLSKVRRDLIIQCTHGIHAWQLERLGITPAPEELRLHGSLGCLAADLPQYEPQRAAEWLIRLYRSNEQRMLYSRDEFVSVLLEKMALSCINRPSPLASLTQHYMPFPGAEMGMKLRVLLKIARRNLDKKLFNLMQREYCARKR